MQKSRSARAALLAIAAAICLSACAERLKAHGTVMDQAAPEIKLDYTGHAPFVLSQHRGKIVLIFFGYTHCGDVCPTTLAHIAQAVDRVGSTRVPIEAVFISVDPKRDSGVVAARYAAMFHRDFIGVTGTPEELADIQKAYHVWSKAMPRDKNGNYDVAHSSETFVVAPNGHIRILEDWDVSVSDLTEDLQAIGH